MPPHFRDKIHILTNYIYTYLLYFYKRLGFFSKITRHLTFSSLHWFYAIYFIREQEDKVYLIYNSFAEGCFNIPLKRT